jgi:DNA end-binding protein Ku
LMQRIEAKLQGKQIMEQPSMPEPRVIDLFDALKASLEQAKAAKPSKRKSG